MKKKRLPLAMLAALGQKPEPQGEWQIVMPARGEFFVHPIRWRDTNTGTEVTDFNIYLSPMRVMP